MQPMSDGMELNPQMHIQVLQNKLAQSAIREAQMETAIQQLLYEKSELEVSTVPKQPIDVEAQEG